MAMSIQSKGSAWQQMQNWHAKQKQAAAEFESSNTSLASVLSDSFSSQGDGLFEITVRKAMASARQRAADRAELLGIDKLM